jgi:uncharacterized protein (DUF1778 family)
MKSFEVNNKAEDVVRSLESIKMDLSSFEDVVTLDDKPINWAPIIKRISELVSETANELTSTSNIGD